MKNLVIIFMALVIIFFGKPAKALTGDRALACQVLLCLSSGDRPAECTKPLKKFFSLKSVTDWRGNIKKSISDVRKDFLKLCPTSSQSGMPQYIDTLSNTAVECSAQFLNKNKKKINVTIESTDKPLFYTGDYNNIAVYIEKKEIEVISDRLPSGCNRYKNHEWTQYNVLAKFYGTSPDRINLIGPREDVIRRYNKIISGLGQWFEQ